MFSKKFSPETPPVVYKRLEFYFLHGHSYGINTKIKPLKSVSFWVHDDWVIEKGNPTAEDLYFMFLPDRAKTKEWVEVDFWFEDDTHFLMKRSGIIGMTLLNTTETKKD